MRLSRLLVVVALLVAVIGFASLYLLRKGRTEESVTPLKVGYIPIADAAQLYVADSKAFFAAEGLAVDLISFAGGAKIIEALAARELDVAFTGTVPLIQASSRGIPLVAISGGSVQTTSNPYQALVVGRDSNVDDASQLAGRLIATNTFRSIDHAFTIAYLDSKGLTPGAANFVEIPFPQMEQVLVGEQVVAASMIEPFLSIAKANGSVRVLAHHVVEIEPHFEMTTYVVTSRWFSEKRDAGRRFGQAMRQATQWAEANQSELRRIVSTYTRIAPEIADTMVLPRFGTTLDPDRLRRTADLLARLKFIEREPEFELILSGLQD